MTKQPTLFPEDDDTDHRFDAKKAQKKKEDAMRRVEENAKKEFMAAAHQANIQAARELDELTVDDSFALCTVIPHELRAWGPAMTNALEAGVIEKIEGKYRKSTRVTNNRRPQQVYRSLLRK